MNKDIKENLINIVSDTSEALFDNCFVDTFVKNGVLRDIPAFGTVISLIKTGETIKNLRFSNNLKLFFYAEDKLSKNDKEKIYKKINSYKDKQSLGEEIIKVIDDAENSNKARLIGCAIQVLIHDDIDVDFYLELVAQIAKCSYRNLLNIKYFENETITRYSENDIVSSYSLNQLYICGFLYNAGFDGGNIDETTPYGKMYQINKYGIVLRDILITNGFV